jgi:tetratricopeptide (TPR) repeat protein
MKVKTKNVKPNPNVEHRASLNTFRILCFSLVSFCFLTSPACAQTRSQHLGLTDFLIPYLAQISQDAKVRTTVQEKPQTSSIETVNLADELNQKLPQISTAIPGNQTTNPGRQLWRAGISVYEGEKDNKRKNELKRLIEQVRSIEFKPPMQHEPVINIEPTETTVEPNQIPFDVDVAEGSGKNTIESQLPYEHVTDWTLQMIGNIAKDPNQLDNPFKLGEVLFLSGRLKEAAIFYQEAFKRKNPDETGIDLNRAWILFQIGNCLRDDDLSTAQKMYRQLIAQYPGSPWADLAKAREKIIDWYLKEKPKTLIAESQL